MGIIGLIEENMADRGFARMNCNIAGVRVWFQEMQDTVYTVVLMEVNEMSGFDGVRYERVCDAVRQTLWERYGSDLQLQGVLVTDNPMEAKLLCSYAPTWILDTVQKQLIIYENQAPEFLTLKDLLEDSLMGKRTQFVDRSFIIKFKQNIPVCVLVILALNVLIFIVTTLQQKGFDSGSLFYGASVYWPAITEDKEYYRLFTYMFLHFGISHLANNMLILFVIGSKLEIIIGRIRFLLIYIISGIAAGMASMFYNMELDQIAVSAGASGAIFGIVGAMVWVVLKSRGRVEGLSVRQIIFFAALSLMNGFANQQTDNAAHIGGLVAGFLLAILLYWGMKKPKVRTSIDEG